VKALANKLRARQTAPDKFGLAAAFGDWCDAREALDFLCALITRAIGAKGCPYRKIRLSFFSYTYRHPVLTVNFPLLPIPLF
jgi:hypothetical protein